MGPKFRSWSHRDPWESTWTERVTLSRSWGSPPLNTLNGSFCSRRGLCTKVWTWSPVCWSSSVCVCLSAEVPDYSLRVSYMKDLVRSLPLPNHDTMELLFKHLRKWVHSEASTSWTTLQGLSFYLMNLSEAWTHLRWFNSALGSVSHVWGQDQSSSSHITSVWRFITCGMLAGPTCEQLKVTSSVIQGCFDFFPWFKLKCQVRVFVWSF